MICSLNEKTDFQVSEPLICETGADLFLKNCLLCGKNQENLIFLSQCLHSFCQACGESHVNSCLLTNQTLISCPLCPLFMDSTQIHQVSGENTLKRYRRLSSLNPILRNCPKLACEGFGVQKPENFGLTCNFCSQKFCLYCGKVQHFNYPCRIIDDLLLEKWLTEAEARFCPQCNYFYIRDESGCPLTQCYICSNKWCWYCGLITNSAEHHCEANKGKVLQEFVEIPVFNRKKYENFLLGIFSSLIFITYPIWSVLNGVLKHEKGEKNWTGVFFKIFKFKVIVYLSAFVFSILFWPVGMIIIGYKCGKSFLCTVICNGNYAAGKCVEVLFLPLIVGFGLIGCILFVVILTIFSPISLCLKFEVKDLLEDDGFIRS